MALRTDQGSMYNDNYRADLLTENHERLSTWTIRISLNTYTPEP